jgi:hypothetical protein
VPRDTDEKTNGLVFYRISSQQSQGFQSPEAAPGLHGPSFRHINHATRVGSLTSKYAALFASRHQSGNEPSHISLYVSKLHRCLAIVLDKAKRDGMEETFKIWKTILTNDLRRLEQRRYASKR